MKPPHSGVPHKLVEPPDGGWGWLIVFTSMLSTSILYACRASFSIIYIEWVDYFQGDKGSIGWIGSLFLSTGSLVGVVFGAFIDVYGCRIVTLAGSFFLTLGMFTSTFGSNAISLCITYGLIAGLGLGMVTLSSTVIVQQYFHKKRPLAAGLALCGHSFGNMAGGPLMQALIDWYGWRGAMTIMAGICLQTAVIGMTFRPIKPKVFKIQSREIDILNTDGETVTATKSSSLESSSTLGNRLKNRIFDFSIFRNAGFVLCLVGEFFAMQGLASFLSHTPSRAVSVGIERHEASLLLTFYGAAGLPARITTSFLANVRCVNRILLHGVGIILAGTFFALNTFAMTFTTSVIAVILIGMFRGCYMSLYSTILVDLVGIEQGPKAQAFYDMVVSIGVLIATPFTGYLFELTSSYAVPLCVAGSLEVAGGLFICLITCIQRIK